MFSTKAFLLDLCTKIYTLEGRDEIYHSICISTPGPEVAGILFNNLLKMELKYFIFYPKFIF